MTRPEREPPRAAPRTDPVGPADPPASASADRPLRAHARRNREKLLAVARARFAESGDGVPLENIAREAGVGIGTLYRHFPQREALVEAVYAAELDDLTSSAPGLLDRYEPEEALRAWMDRYALFAAAKRGMADTIRSVIASGRLPTPATRERINAAIATILAAGARTGGLRADVEADDVTAMLLGVFLSTEATNSPERTGPLLDLLVDALRPRA
ncbi:TetR/AcrR family transcriptional regulator [Streptomyces sp. NPDC054784]